MRRIVSGLAGAGALAICGAAFGAAPLPESLTRTAAVHVRRDRPAPRIDRPDRIDAATIRQTARDLPDALARAPGLVVDQVGGSGHGGQTRLRGAAAAQTRWSLGGVPLVAPTGRALDPEDLPLSLLQRVDVHANGAPTSFGSETMGGTVDLQLGAPPAARLQLAAGRYGLGIADGAVGWGARNARQSGFVGVRALRSAGDFGYRDDGGTAFDRSDDRERTRENNEVRRVALAAGQTLRWQTGSVQAIWLGNLRRQGLAGAAGQTTRAASLDHHGHDLVLAANGHGRALRWSVRGHGGWLSETVDDVQGELGVALSREIRVRALQLGGEIGAREWRLGSSVRFSPAIRIAGRLGQSHGEDLRLGMPTPSSTARGLEAGLAAPLQLGDDWTLSARGQLTWASSSRAEDPAYSGAWQRRDVAPRLLPTGRLGIRWRATPAVALHLGISAANRAPNLLELFGNDGSVRGNALLRDERSLGVDASLRWQGALGPLQAQARLGASARRQQDLIGLVRTAPASAVWLNIGAAQMLAVDAGGTLRWPGYGALLWSASALDARDRGDDPAYVERRLPLLAQLRGALTLALERRRLGPIEVDAFCTVRARDERYADRANLVALPARTRVDAGIGSQRGRLRLDVRVDNLSAADDQDLLGFPLPGRAFRVALSWGFE